MRIRTLFLFAGCALSGWFLFSSYSYFFDKSKPAFVMHGIEQDKFYSGSVDMLVSSDKTGYFSLFIDNKEVIAQERIKVKNPDQVVTLDLSDFSDGIHTLKTVFTDTNYHKNTVVQERDFYVDNINLEAHLLKNGDYKAMQGRTLKIAFCVNKPIASAKLSAFAHSYDCVLSDPNTYECYVPIPCEEKVQDNYLFAVKVKDNVGNIVDLQDRFKILPGQFKTQHITLDKQKVEQEKELGKTKNDFETAMQEITQNSPKKKLWCGSFCAPIDIVRTTCDFGTVRTTQEKGRYRHAAVDVINTPKSVVWATQDGIVALKDRFAESGNTIAIDHGCGIISLFFHLDEFADIEVGQKICKGNPVGTLGKTGYAAGYHLHWEMRIQNIAVDPLQWVNELI